MRALLVLTFAVYSCTPMTNALAAEPARGAVSSATDRMAILELSARFDNSLDSEDADKFVATFAPDGALVGFWGEAKGSAEIRKAHAFMLSTFARNKRHIVTNHEISVDGNRARMFCYLTVFDRTALAMTGTATFTDELSKRDGVWRFTRRELRADPNVDGIIASLKGK